MQDTVDRPPTTPIHANPSGDGLGPPEVWKQFGDAEGADDGDGGDGGDLAFGTVKITRVDVDGSGRQELDEGFVDTMFPSYFFYEAYAQRDLRTFADLVIRKDLGGEPRTAAPDEDCR